MARMMKGKMNNMEHKDLHKYADQKMQLERSERKDEFLKNIKVKK